MQRSKGYDSSTRKLYRRAPREKGLRSLRYLLEPFEVGQKVDIILNSQSQKGRPHRRFHGKKGTVLAKQGQAYIVAVKKGNKENKVIANPEHLRAAKVEE